MTEPGYFGGTLHTHRGRSAPIDVRFPAAGPNSRPAPAWTGTLRSKRSKQPPEEPLSSRTEGGGGESGPWPFSFRSRSFSRLRRRRLLERGQGDVCCRLTALVVGGGAGD